MNMTNSIHNTLFSSSIALPVPPGFEGSGSVRPEVRPAATRASGTFDIYDAEGHLPEILCRVMLGLCLAYTVVECALQLAAS